ncbi:hypothetical protein DPMN_182042 [Dreissena polymorpha]|uniref:Pacifastin domain-containing protein n=1 Tax=Dreissena polymorpha TaxID=45954 RepID=A0A9D4DE03_DREPO|nr:hypothetical protein DPMN_182042 [Dreissena polymorpha]
MSAAIEGRKRKHGRSVITVDCALVQCAAPQCVDSFTPPGQCCPVCEGKKSCNYKGRVYKHGSQFNDECNTCGCYYGSVQCTEMACLANPSGEIH